MFYFQLPFTIVVTGSSSTRRALSSQLFRARSAESKVTLFVVIHCTRRTAPAAAQVLWKSNLSCPKPSRLAAGISGKATGCVLDLETFLEGRALLRPGRDFGSPACLAVKRGCTAIRALRILRYTSLPHLF